MEDFTYKISGKTYTASYETFVNATVNIKADSWFSKESNCVFAAKDAFLKAINANLFKDDSRSYHHKLHINGELVWEHYWQDKPKGDFNLANLFESLSDYLYRVQILKEGDDLKLS